MWLQVQVIWFRQYEYRLCCQLHIWSVCWPWWLTWRRWLMVRWWRRMCPTSEALYFSCERQLFTSACRLSVCRQRVSMCSKHDETVTDVIVCKWKHPQVATKNTSAPLYAPPERKLLNKNEKCSELHEITRLSVQFCFVHTGKFIASYTNEAIFNSQS